MNDPNKQVVNISSGLSAFAVNRELITTPEIAKVFNVESQIVCKSYSLTGDA